MECRNLYLLVIWSDEFGPLKVACNCKCKKIIVDIKVLSHFVVQRRNSCFYSAAVRTLDFNRLRAPETQNKQLLCKAELVEHFILNFDCRCFNSAVNFY